MSNTPLISVIIVNFNGQKYLRACMESIKRALGKPFEIIVVDNASSDGSVGLMKKNFPEALVIENKINLGFSAGNNLGAKEARGEYLLFLNNDTELINDPCILIDIIDADSNIGLIGAKMLSADGEYRASAGCFPKLRRLICLRSLYKNSGSFRSGDFSDEAEKSHKVDWTEGSFIFTRRVLWEELDGMDEEYFLYGEDIDLAQRYLYKGYKTLYCPRVSYMHHGGYDKSKLPLLIKGLSRYHEKFSNSIVYLLAVLILRLGYAMRVFLKRAA